MHIHYQQHVKSPTADWIVFFHGMGGDCSIFYKQIPFFQEHFNLLLIDLPGHGRSASLEGQEPVEFSARQVIELLERVGEPGFDGGAATHIHDDGPGRREVPGGSRRRGPIEIGDRVCQLTPARCDGAERCSGALPAPLTAGTAAEAPRWGQGRAGRA